MLLDAIFSQPAAYVITVAGFGFLNSHVCCRYFFFLGCPNPVTVGKYSVEFYEGNRINLHYPLLQCFGKIQPAPAFCFQLNLNTSQF